MLRRLLHLLRLAPKPRTPLNLPTIDRAQIASFLTLQHDLPHLDWGAIAAWIERASPDPAAHASLRRAATAAWLDELRDALPEDHRRWRNERVEGLGPLQNNLAQRTARAADNAFKVIEPSLAPMRGPAPIPPVAVIALATSDSYYSFLSRNPDDEGESATSGGMYINDGNDSFPIIVLPVQLKHSIEETIAHELTHHALHAANLPLWVEEGLTQMMEERVTGQTNFRLDRELLRRHREHWLDDNLDRFLSGEGFSSPEGDEQELSYHLSQVVIRGLLARDPKSFFAFAGACRDSTADEAALEHLGCTPAELVERSLART